MTGVSHEGDRRQETYLQLQYTATAWATETGFECHPHPGDAWKEVDRPPFTVKV